MPFHEVNRSTGYELAAINNKTGERIFICCVSGSKSRRAINSTLFAKVKSKGKTRLELLSAMIGVKSDRWRWGAKAADGCNQGEWQIRFTSRTGKDLDQEGTGRSIYDDETTS